MTLVIGFMCGAAFGLCVGIGSTLRYVNGSGKQKSIGSG